MKSKSKSKTKTNSKNTETFVDSVKNKYRAIVVSSPIAKEEEICFFVNQRDDGSHLTYDDVESVAFESIEKIYPEEYYPKSELKRIEILFNGNWYPVLRESDKDEIKRMEKSSDAKRILVLPDATYCFTPAFKLYYELCEKGVIDKDETPFDFEKFKEISDSMNPKEK